MSEFEYNDNLVSCTGNDYDSAFETDSEKRKKKSAKDSVLFGASASSESIVRLKDVKEHAQQECSREAKRQQRCTVPLLDAYSRHKKLINDYFLCYKGQAEKLRRDCSKDRTDADALRDNHRFVWDDVDTSQLSWEERLAKKYYDKLFKEYCITDLSRYKQQQIAFRWRGEQEVIAGKGQFSCGERNCKNDQDLRSWEVNFAYVEHGERKNALVKVRLCETCSRKLNHRKQRREVTKTPKAHGELSKCGNRKRKYSRSSKSKPDKGEKARRRTEEDASSSESSGSGEEASVKVLEEKRSEEANPWAKPVLTEVEPKIEDEFDSFLDDMLL